MGCLHPLRMGLCLLPAASNRCILHMDRAICAAAEDVLGLGRMNGVFSACKDNALLGRGHIGRGRVGRLADGLGDWAGCRNSGRRFGAIEDNPFLGRRSIGNRAGRRRTLHSEHLWSRPAASDNNAFLGRRSNRCVVLGMAV